MSRIWTSVSLDGESRETSTHRFFAGYDYRQAESTFQEAHPGARLVVLMPGEIELRTYDTTKEVTHA